jgi:gliding motility-associated-like protein
MGAEITYTHVSGNDYEVTLVVYRDCSGISLSTTSQTVTFQSASCGQNFTSALPYVSTIDVSQVCGTALTTCNGGTNPGTQQYVYRGIVTMTPCTDWIMRWNSGTRNPATTNLVSASTRNLYIQNTLNNIAGVNNNSPQFFNIPTPYLCINQLVIYSHAASDPDGDSLYYSLATPLTTPGPPGTPIPFAGGYTQAQPMITSSGMNLNQQTGEMCFTPSAIQVSVVSILIEEFRNNVLIGTQIREMQVIVANCTNQNPTTGVAPTCGGAGGMTNITGGASVDSVDQNSILMCPNESVCFDVIFSDPDGDDIYVTSNAAIAMPGATFTVLNDSTPNPIGTFCWTPTALDSGLNVFTVILEDNACPISGLSTFTYDVTIFDQPYAGPDDTICETQPTQLVATGGSGYTWFDVATNTQMPVGANFSCNPCFNPIATPLVTTKYYVLSSLTAACENTDTVEITVIPGYTLASTQNDTNICVGETVDFSTTPSIAGTYTYNWTTAFGSALATPSDSATIGTFTAPGTETILVEVNNVNCVLFDTFFVHTAAVPNINITTPDTLLDCVNSLPINVDLNGAPTPNDYSYVWTYPTTLDTADIQNPDATPTQAITNYAVVVTDTLGNCFDTDTVEVKSCCIQFPTVLFENSTCFDLDNGKITASAVALNSDFTIEFHRNDPTFTLLQSSSGNLEDSITNLGPGNYIVLMFDTIGCSYSDTLTITEPFPVTLTNVTPDTSICINGTATLYGTAGGATAPVNLIWSNGLVGNGPHQVNPTFFSTLYTVFAQDANGCTSPSQNIIVSLRDSIEIDTMLITEETICREDKTTLLVYANGGGTGLIYTWLNGNNTIIGATDTGAYTVTPSYDGEIFTVIVSDSCTTPTKTVSVMTDWADLVLPTYIVNDSVGCFDKIKPFITNTTPSLGNMSHVHWDFGDGNTFDSPFSYQIDHAYDAPGLYDITLTVTDQYGCEWDTIMGDYQIDAHGYPTADFVWNPNPTDYLNAEITFNNQSVGNVFNEWLFITDAAYTSNVFDPVFQFPQNQPGDYDVTLTVTNKHGCRDSITKIVVIDDVFLFYIPTAFTPDGDGLNDNFKVVGEGLDLSNFKMSIFNKWGELVFESSNPDIGWDGTYKGSLVPDGVYVWKIDAKEAHSSVIQRKDGYITIVR